MDGTIEEVSFLGSVVRIRVRFGDNAVSIDTFNNPGIAPPARGIEGDGQLRPRRPAASGGRRGALRGGNPISAHTRASGYPVFPRSTAVLKRLGPRLRGDEQNMGCSESLAADRHQRLRHLSEAAVADEQLRRDRLPPAGAGRADRQRAGDLGPRARVERRWRSPSQPSGPTRRTVSRAVSGSGFRTVTVTRTVSPSATWTR